MSLTIGAWGLLLTASAFGQVPEQQNTDQLSARELYYMEKPADDKLPPVSSDGPAHKHSAKSEPTNTGSRAPNAPGRSTRVGHDTKSSQPHSDNVVNHSANVSVVNHLGLRYS